MKSLVKAICAATVFLIGFLYIMPLFSLAESAPGKKDLEAKADLFQDQQESELEKMAPDLFKKQTEAEINTKEAEIKKVKQKIFANPPKPDTEFKKMEKVMFTRDYSVPHTNTPNETKQLQVKDIVKFTAFGAAIAAACAGVFIILKKWLG